MIGIFKPCFKCMPIESKKIYKGIYCSLCIALKKKHGFLYTLFISHEIVQLNISCLKYYNVSSSFQRCSIPLRKRKKEVISHKALDVSADFCILLVWFKVVDSMADKENMKFRILYYLIKGKAMSIIDNLPEGLKQKSLRYIDLITTNSSYNEIIDETGNIAKLIFNSIVNELNLDLKKINEIENIGKGYGELIALSDPLLDYLDDKKKKKKSPFDENEYSFYYDKFVQSLIVTQNLIVEKSDKGLINKYFKTAFLLASNDVYKKVNRVQNELTKNAR